MDLSDPTRAVTPTLDGPVLAVLAAAGRPLTVGEVAVQAARGSEIGIRRSIARLVDQGIVRATIMGRNWVHELNREHVAADVAELMTGLRLELWRRLRAEIAGWDLPPLYAAVFGSAARGDGDESSDIDILLVHAPLRDEDPRPTPAKKGAAGVQAALDAIAIIGVIGRDAPGHPDVWQAQVDRLRDRVHRWTGNPLQVVDLSIYEWWQPDEATRRLLADVKRDGIEVARAERLPRHLAWEVGGG